MEQSKNILIVGVTGPIGSGKSTVCRLFEKKGIPVFRADEVAKEVSVQDPEVRKRIIELIGPEAFTPNGELNRRAIAEKIFSNAPLRKQYEALLHPRTQAEIEKRIRALESNAPFVIVEAALLYEAGWDNACDYVLVVDAPKDICLQRVCARDQVSERDVRARMEAQHSSTSKVAKADFVIHNTGSLEDLERSVTFFYQLLSTMKGGMNRG